MFCVQLIFKWADISCLTTMGDLYSTVAVWAVVHRCDGAGRREGGALHRRPLRRHQAHRRTHRSVPLPPITHYQMIIPYQFGKRIVCHLAIEFNPVR